MKIRNAATAAPAAPFPVHARYDPLDWHWIVADAPANRMWSSAALAYVATSSPAYQAWIAQGRHPTKIASRADLLQVMQHNVQPTFMARGVTLVSEKAETLNGRYALDDKARAWLGVTRVAIMSGRPLPGGGETFNYLDADFNHHMFTGPQFLEFAEACEHYIYDWTQALIANIAGHATAYPPNKVAIG